MKVRHLGSDSPVVAAHALVASCERKCELPMGGAGGGACTWLPSGVPGPKALCSVKG